MGREMGAESCSRIVIERGTLAHIHEVLKRNATIPHAHGCPLCERFVKAVALAEPHVIRAANATTNGTGLMELPRELVEAVAEQVAELLSAAEFGGQDRWLRGADRIAAYLDCPRSRVYALTSARRIPVQHDGSALVARRSELDRWLRDGGGRRP